MSDETPYRPRTMRACVSCKYVAPQKDFNPTCKMCGQREQSKNFTGLISVFDTKHTWAGKFVNVSKPGLHAIRLDDVASAVKDDDDYMDDDMEDNTTNTYKKSNSDDDIDDDDDYE